MRFENRGAIKVIAQPDNLHPLAGTEREPGWTVKDETDALAVLERKHDLLMKAVLAEKGEVEGTSFILRATESD